MSSRIFENIFRQIDLFRQVVLLFNLNCIVIKIKLSCNYSSMNFISNSI